MHSRPAEGDAKKMVGSFYEVIKEQIKGADQNKIKGADQT